MASHGLGGFYKGVASPLVGNMALNAVQFTVYQKAKDLFTEDGRKDTLSRVGAAAAFTGLFVALVEGPQDLVKTQMQAQMMTAKSGALPAGVPVYTSTGNCASTILKQRGFAGLGQGLPATFLRNFIGVGSYYYFYEATRRWQAGDRPVSELNSWQVLLAGGAAGIAYWTLAWPADLWKSAMQMDALNPEQRKYKSIAHCARALWAEGGMQRYSAGFGPCIARAFPANAAGFVTYEWLKSNLDKKSMK